MAERPDDPVVPIEDEFSVLPEDEQVRCTTEWAQSLRQDKEPLLGVSGAELVAEARTEMGW